MTEQPAEHEHRVTSVEKRSAVARDVFSYLHLPLVTGIVLVALPMKKTLAHVDDPLDLIPALGLFGGSAL